MEFENSLPWNKKTEENKKYIKYVEKSILQIFLTKQGHALWKYLQETVFMRINQDNNNINNLQQLEGQKILLMKIKHMAERAGKGDANGE